MSLKNAVKKENNRLELEVEVDAAAFDAAVEKAYRKNIGKMNIAGFRKGKAPRHFVEKIYGEGVFYEDAVNDLYPVALDEAIKASGYEYVEDKIDLDVEKVGKDGLLFKAVITVKPEVEIDDYKGIPAAKKVKRVTEAEITAELKKLQDRNARMVTVEDRAAQKDDEVIFDFDGYIDDKPFDGGKAENHSLVLGSGQFIPGFEDQIIGKKAEEAFDVNVTFPEDYHAKELAGKPAVFKCKLHEIKEKQLPELNDDFAKDCSEFETLDELKADIKKTLDEQHKKAAESDFEGKIIDELIKKLKADIPEAMYENRINDSVQGFEQRLQAQGLTLDMYLKYTGMDRDAFRKGFREQAEKSVKVRLALEKIAQQENLAATDEDMEKEYKDLAEQYQLDVEKVKQFVPAQELAKDVAVKKAMDFVKANAKAPAKK
ncbi:MAG: trigger factor [Clostridia bacterium]|nr:trigger factor [Clostridia bacterium]